MLREFQAEIARLKTQLAERQQARAASAGGSPEKQAMQAAAAAASAGGTAGAGNDSGTVDAHAAAIRKSMRAELQRQMRKAVSLEALAKARQAIEQQARYGGAAAGQVRRGGSTPARSPSFAGFFLPACTPISRLNARCTSRVPAPRGLAGSAWRQSWPAGAPPSRSASTRKPCWLRSRRSCSRMRQRWSGRRGRGWRWSSASGPWRARQAQGGCGPRQGGLSSSRVAASMCPPL